MKTRSILAALMVAALLVPACTKHRIPATHEHGGNTQNPGGNNNNNGQGQGGNQNTEDQGLKLNMRSDWSIAWERSWWDYVEADGSLSDVEVISIACPGAEYFMVREFTSDWFQSEYNNDLKAYLEDEEKYLLQDVESAGSVGNVWYVYNNSINELLLDRARSGERVYLLVGINKDGKITGDYAKCVHMFEQERATDEYNKWIGKWLVTNGRVGYDITISKSESNWLYWIDGWETGESVTEQMIYESIEARFDRSTGNLVFFSQYIQSYYDENENLQLYEYFLGNISDSSSDAVGITDTGLKIAVASFDDEDGALATISPLKVNVRREDGSIWETEFTSMCYWNVDSDSEQPVWMRYNATGLAKFPLSMTFQPGTKAAASEIVAVERELTPLSVHKSQSRAHNVEHGSTGVCYEGNRR